MTRLVVRHAGPHVTWQDAGRPGQLRHGVPASGPMDRGAWTLARAALGGPGPAIEVSLGGLRLDCVAGAVSLAVAGGGFVVEKGSWRGGSWVRLTLRAGETLVLRPGFWGNWTYLAFAAPPDLPFWLGSCATHGPSGLGGGRLTTGQEIVLPEAALLPEARLACPPWARPREGIRAVPGPQDRFFAAETLAAFFGAAFTLSPAFDRMGLRLDGPALPPEGALSIPSEPILRGSVQVNGAGVASVLMADHQTTGGYPKIATAIDADLDQLAQLRPGRRLRFEAVAPERAAALLLMRRRSLERATENALDARSN